jgi:hypothetical protein
MPLERLETSRPGGRLVSSVQKWLLTMSGQTGINCNSGGKIKIDWLNQNFDLWLDWRSPVHHVAGEPVDINPKVRTEPFFIPEQWSILVTLNKASTFYDQFLIHSWDILLDDVEDILTSKSYKIFSGLRVRVSHIGGDGSVQSVNIGFQVTMLGKTQKISYPSPQ